MSVSGITNLGQCIYCTRYKGFDGKKLACDAFPEGIPEPIAMGDFDHRVQYGDEDLLFKVAEGMEDGFSAWAATYQRMQDLPPVSVNRERTQKRPPLGRDR